MIILIRHSVSIESQNRRIKKSSKKESVSKRKKESSFHLEIAEHILRDTLGIVYALFAVVLFLGLIGSAGILGGQIESMLSVLFGVGKWLIPILFLGLSLAMFFAKKVEFTFTRNLGLFLLLSSLLGMIHLGTPLNTMDKDVENYGGWVGFTAAVIFRLLFSTQDSDLTAGIILFGFFTIGILISFELSFRDIWDYFYPKTELKPVLSRQEENEDAEDAEIRIIKPITIPEVIEEKPKRLSLASKLDDAVKELGVKRPAKKDAIEITNFQVSGDWEFPSLDLLANEISSNYPSDEILHRQAQNIEEKLAEFDIHVKMVDARVGPTVTQFTASPEEGISVKKIANSKEDLALALSAKSVRIEAPIPGQPYVGIEIPNETRSTVYMREILESEEFANIHSSLRLAIGKDVAGNPVVADLGKMPHLLIAGATGSGKSVGMNSFLISLLYQNSPADLKFIMVDPKRVELTGYNGIPHLLTPVITEADKALAALKWAVSEMMQRYQECSDKGYRNIEEYNAAESRKMPKIVIVIDELADLMMRDFRKDTEAAICRLAQMARAVGMHLIIATQRPSVDVITGVIKANIPTRISFTVTSAVDSRTILDSIGAEDLLGQGDMLYTNASLPKPMRIQGIYISSKEIEKVVKHIKLAQGEDGLIPQRISFDERQKASLPGTSVPLDLDAIQEASEEDELVPEAIEVIKRTGKASATLLQRMLSVGYARAAKLLDILEQKGMIGPANGAKPREIYFDQTEEE